MRTPPPLPPELDAFLAPHRTVLPLPASVETRAMARAAAAVEWSSPRAIRAAAPRRWVFAAAAGAAVIMGAAAYAAHAWIGAVSSPPPAPPAPAAVEAPRGGTLRTRALSPAPATPPPVSDAPVTVSPEAMPRRRVMSRTPGAPARAASHAELQLLRTAHEDVTNGDYGDALIIIAEHSRRFRNGSLVEEREALRVKSLAELGRYEDAQHAAAEFHGRFPRSVFLSTFEHMKGQMTGQMKGTDR